MSDPGITGVATDIAGFAGPGGPATPIAVTAVAELDLPDGDMAAAARCFFANGGRTLYVAATLEALADIEDIALVATPGQAPAGLVEHVDRYPWRFAIADAPLHASASDARALRTQFDSTNAALYHPWIICRDEPDPVPPSGAVAGLLAAARVADSVSTTSVIDAVDVVEHLSGPALGLLTRADVNVLRAFPGADVRVWGARTISSDPEWKYVNVRRLFIYLEHSIDAGTKWAVFEPNDEPLWRTLAGSVHDFLEAEWRSGALPGRTPEEAFFVRCDRTTMTQDDIDNGRVVALIGVAVTRPAEFVIFRIGQWTADHR